MNRAKNRVIVFTIIIAATVALVFAFTYFTNAPHRKDLGEAYLAALIEHNAVKPFSLRPRTKTGDCEVRGPLPDPACTPGAVFLNVDEKQICTQGYTKTARNVSVDLKSQVYAEYGLSYPQSPGAYEADHLIPLELGGNNDIANLFPEAAEPTPGFHEKDLVENYLNHEVCAGRVSLPAAQEQIAKDWPTVYEHLTPTQIDELKREFAH